MLLVIVACVLAVRLLWLIADGVDCFFQSQNCERKAKELEREHKRLEREKERLKRDGELPRMEQLEEEIKTLQAFLGGTLPKNLCTDGFTVNGVFYTPTECKKVVDNLGYKF